MVIGDKLKELRETKNLSPGDIESVLDFRAVMFPASKTVIPCLQLIRWRRWPARSKYRHIGF